MSSLDDWEEDFVRAIEGYRRSTTSRLISFDSSRIYTYMKQHQGEFSKVMKYVDANDWGKFRMMDLIGKYLRFRGVNHKIIRVNPPEMERTGGVLYASKVKASVFGEE